MSSQSADFPSADRVAEIAAMDDPALRNLWITWSYYQLNHAMRDVIGPRDLSWCGFAVWASNTAGTFIRQEEVPALLRDWIDGAYDRANPLVAWASKLFVTVFGSAGAFDLRTVARQILDEVTGAIGGGNQNVFANIAPPFAELLSRWRDNGGPLDEVEREAFLQKLRESDDQKQGAYLAEAFAAMFAAQESGEPRFVAQQLLYANACIGYVEQLRVQPYIVQSMNAPVAALFMDAAKGHLFGHHSDRIARALLAIFRPALERFADALEREFRRLSTEWLMTLNLPTGKLRLGHNLPPLPDGNYYRDDLDELDSPQPLDLMQQIHATNALRTAADDWQSFDERMRYIGALFRSRQQEEPLFAAPFTDAQVATMEQGRVPTGL